MKKIQKKVQVALNLPSELSKRIDQWMLRHPEITSKTGAILALLVRALDGENQKE